MNIPSTAYQLGILLVLVMPGIVYAAVRSRLRGPGPEDREIGIRVLRAMMVSAALDSLYAVAFGPHLYRSTHPVGNHGEPISIALRSRQLGFWVFLLVFVIPATIAFIGNRFRIDRSKSGLSKIRMTRGYHPTPSAWDWATGGLGGCFLRIRLTDGHFVGGWLGKRAFTSTYPEPRDVYFDVQHKMAADGTFLGPVQGGLGMYVALTGGEVVDWVLAPSQAARLVGADNVSSEGTTKKGLRWKRKERSE